MGTRDGEEEEGISQREGEGMRKRRRRGEGDVLVERCEGEGGQEETKRACEGREEEDGETGGTGGWRETEGEIDGRRREKERGVTRSSCRGDCADVRGKVLRRDSP